MKVTLVRSFCTAATLAGLIFATGSAVAAPIVLDFEGVGDKASVGNFYNGGTDSQGNSGPNYGVGFSDTSLGVVDLDAGGSGNIANEPSPDTALFFQSGGAATMNVAAGFDTLSFFYAAINQPGAVTVYDGLNGMGNILANQDLSITSANCSGDPSGRFCAFDPISVLFAGAAQSVDFSGVANEAAFDDIALNTQIAGDVPEPASVATLGLGLVLIAAGLVLPQRRRR